MTAGAAGLAQFAQISFMREARGQYRLDTFKTIILLMS
jgi:hypothetical protein